MKVLNFNDPYIDSKGDVNNLEDVLSDASVKESIDDINNNLNASNAGAHNSVYRGKYLGNALTTEQKAQISAGTFNDLYIGDYWTINGVNYRIAHFDYYLNLGDKSCTTHHALIIPDSCLYNAQINTSDVTTGGYKGSEMYTSNLEQAKTTINSAFSGNVLSHRIYITNATSNGIASSGEWADSTVELMNEQMVYGSGIFSPVSNGTIVPANYRVDTSQVALFNHNPSLIVNRVNWWLRDVINDSGFALVSADGRASYYHASSSFGVRPAFGITG